MVRTERWGRCPAVLVWNEPWRNSCNKAVLSLRNNSSNSSLHSCLIGKTGSLRYSDSDPPGCPDSIVCTNVPPLRQARALPLDLYQSYNITAWHSSSVDCNLLHRVLPVMADHSLTFATRVFLFFISRQPCKDFYVDHSL